MLPPFYHLEAEERGLHPLEVLFSEEKKLCFPLPTLRHYFPFQKFGFVFGIAHLASLIATPFAGKWTVALRPKQVHLVLPHCI